jgi:hypothetical protein
LNRKRLIAALVGALATGAALWFYAAQGRRMHAVPVAAKALASVATPSPTPLPIPDGKTLDFSNGAGVVKESAADKAALDAGVKEIDDATKAVTFPANPPPPK